MENSRRILDLTGIQVFRLRVLACLDSKMNTASLWKCECSCGTICNVGAFNLAHEKTKSCGCLKNELLSARAKAATKHGMEGTPTYVTWIQMRQRCYSKKHHKYPLYGGKGIRICDRWNEFAHFVADMGLRPKGKTIDRIDSEGNYEPGNCRWADPYTQNRNRKTVPLYLFNGKQMPITEIAERTGISHQVLWKRVKKKNMTIEEAVARPVQKRRKSGDLQDPESAHL